MSAKRGAAISDRRRKQRERYAAEPPAVTLRGRSRTGKLRRRWGGLRLGVEVLFRARRSAG